MRSRLLAVVVLLGFVFVSHLVIADESHPSGDDAANFWAFSPISNPSPPEMKDSSWAKTSIDRFIYAKYAEQRLTPVSQADKRKLIRRATFDLIGLPPTPAEVDAFIEDKSPQVFETVVDRLLASKHYGERWARHWLDIARYGEDQAHSFKPRLYHSGFRYRDWVVNALNEDMPYDRFITEQLAADLLDGPEKFKRLPALGFFAVGPVYYGDKLKFDQLDDRIDTLCRGVLGLTVACARCHDHKYDPIPTKDYYSLAGVFASTEYVEAPLVSAEVVAEYEDAQKAIKTQQDKINKLLDDESKRLKVSKKEIEKKLPEETRQKVMEMRKEMNRLKKAAPEKYPIAHSLKESSKIRNLKVNLRGNPKTPGEEAPRGFLSILSGGKTSPFKKGSGRLELAAAITSSENPLTARVIVNRLWKHHFGTGLVSTTSNFGVLGEPPTHPLLLDHLASQFMSQGWSMKKLHRQIMLSSVYQLSSSFDQKCHKIDPQNKMLWRMNRRRLEVEAWRDALLVVSGKLDMTVGGPSQNLASADNHRRTLYGQISRHDLDPLLRLFDFPEPNITNGNRSVTTVPLQQLFVLNSEFMIRQAQALTKRLHSEGSNDQQRIDQAFQLLFSRKAAKRELEQGLAFLGRSNGGQKDDESEQKRLSTWDQYSQALLSTNEFMYVD